MAPLQHHAPIITPADDFLDQRSRRDTGSDGKVRSPTRLCIQQAPGGLSVAGSVYLHQSYRSGAGTGACVADDPLSPNCSGLVSHLRGLSRENGTASEDLGCRVVLTPLMARGRQAMADRAVTVHCRHQKRIPDERHALPFAPGPEKRTHPLLLRKIEAYITHTPLASGREIPPVRGHLCRFACGR